MELFLDEQAIPDLNHYLKTILGNIHGKSDTKLSTNNVSSAPLLGTLLSPKESIPFMIVNGVKLDSPEWDAINDARLHHTRMKICYCSIFDECFVRESNKIEPEHVEQCKASQPIIFHESEPENYWKIN